MRWRWPGVSRWRRYTWLPTRGGLVGELLGLRDLPADALLPFEQAGAVRSEDIDHLTSLARLLQERQIHIERFVRVACPPGARCWPRIASTATSRCTST